MSNENRNDSEKLDLNKLWETAEHGDAEAQYKVGKCYFEGIGVDEDKTEAFEWFMKAAEQGHSAAQYMVGECYFKNLVTIDENENRGWETFRWFFKAAKQGYTKAIFRILEIPIVLILFMVFVMMFWIKIIGWGIDIASGTAEIVKQAYHEASMCEKAKKEATVESWETYLEEFPDGKCSEMARKQLSVLEPSDADETVETDTEEVACEHSNSRWVWELYLRENPDGKCADEGKAVIEKYRKIGGLEWSYIFVSDNDSSVFNKVKADDYCKNLEEGGHSDWRLPSADELKMIDYSKFQRDKYGYIHELWSYSDEETQQASVRCVRQDDHDACETARKYDTGYLWLFYLKNFPEGECAAEAKAAWEKADGKACSEAGKQNTRAGWESYLRDFPNGKCVKKGRLFVNKFKNLGGLEWSDRSSRTFDDFDEAWDYCYYLNENGHNDWVLPSIDDLRMLVQNHSTTISDGACTEKDFYIFEEDSGCEGEEGGNFSKFGDKEDLLSDNMITSIDGRASGWEVNFGNGGIFQINYDDAVYVRCVRPIDNDAQACNSVMKDPSVNAWNRYLEKFPNGKCAAKAKAALDSICCKKTVSISDWWDYLERFPKGKCATEAKLILDVDSCDTARNRNNLEYWEDYLQKFPEGRCANEGKIFRNRFKKVEGVEWSDILNTDVCNEGCDKESFAVENRRYPEFVTWEHAKSYCAELEEGGHKDWRLPTIEELDMLVSNCSDTENYYDEEDQDSDGSGECFYNRLQSDEEEIGLWGFSDDKFVAVYANVYGTYKDETKKASHSVRCVRQDEPDACSAARKYGKPYYWRFYSERFPDGECIEEAKAALENEDLETCNEARKENTRAAWEKYLKKFPKGKCVDEGKTVRNKFKMVGGLEWSDLSEEPLTAEDAFGYGYDVDNGRYSYCHNLREGGHDDWRFPDIDELRMLIQNHPGTVTGGKCKISYIIEIYDLDETSQSSCEGIDGENFSKLGDNEYIWSSSRSSGGLHFDNDRFNWAVNFSNGGISSNNNYDELFVRCVRSSLNDSNEYEIPKEYELYKKIEDLRKEIEDIENFPNSRGEADLEKSHCEKAIEKESVVDWKYYLKEYPDGVCADEAKRALKELDVKECERARKLKKDGILFWGDYLEDFPEGKCAEEAKRVLEKLHCKDARYFKDDFNWKVYLEDYPKGKCAAEAKSALKKLDKEACEKARKENEYKYWDDYLATFPNGKCSEEAKAAINKLRIIDGLIWSDITFKEFDWTSAMNYCKNLKEDGRNNWRLPNIDELRTLIKNCKNSETDGDCRVSEKKGCLSRDCLKDDYSCGCIFGEDGFYSKLGDDEDVKLWSSSANSDDVSSAWRVDFSSGWVKDYNKSSLNHVRCVR